MAFDINSALKEGYTVKEVSKFLKFDYDNAIKEGYTDDDVVSFLMMDKQQPIKVTETDTLDWGDVPLEAVKNIPSSALEYGKNIWQALRHPIKTGKALSDIVVGAMQPLLPEDIRAFPKQQEMAAQVGSFFKERYGGIENLKKTIAEDPVGFLTDISVPLTIGGAAVTKVGTISKVSGLAKAGRATQVVGRVAEPIGAIGAGVGGLAKLRQPVNSLVKTALQMSKQKGLVKIDELADAFIAKGLNIRRSSLKMLDRDINKVRGAINQIVDKKTTAGIQIKTDNIVKALDDLTTNAAKQGLETLDLRIIERMKGQFSELHGATLTPRQVQDLKVGLNKGFKGNINERFGQVRAKVRDKLRVGAKTQLEELHPELKTLNKNEGVMIELRNSIEEAIIRLEKTPTFESKGLIAGGIAGSVVGGAVGVAVGDIATGLKFAVAAALTAKLLTNPRVQVALAKALTKARLITTQAGRVQRVTRPAFQAGRIARETEQ